MEKILLTHDTAGRQR